ncbi:MAG: ribonuclease H [Acidimicrobiales bacterium]
MAEPTVVVYTDGACFGNPGPGGWAWAVPGGGFASGSAGHTTNQRMEITAALEAVRANGSPDRAVEVVSDSTYVVNCFRDRWWEGWLRKGWVNSQRKPVANRDLWEPLVELVRERGNVTFRWVKGHSGDPMNDLVDRLAVEAAEAQQGRVGDEPPSTVGPADRPCGRRAPPAVSEPATAGRRRGQGRRPRAGTVRRRRRRCSRGTRWSCWATGPPSSAAMTRTTRCSRRCARSWPRCWRPRPSCTTTSSW